MKVNLEELIADIESGHIRRQGHPTLPLSILKYTPLTSYSGEWTTLREHCRGLVVDNEGNIVINCMPKFYNSGEPRGIKDLEICKDLKYTVTNKMDGSLIQVTPYKGELLVTSSGSFTSPQALKAIDLIKKFKLEDEIVTGFTYIFEIIYPENRIVLDYGDQEMLTLLTVRSNGSGKELDIHDTHPGVSDVFKKFDKVQKTNMTIEDINKQLGREDFINQEGFIVKFSNGKRVKFKYDKYVKLHKAMSNLNEKTIWENLKDGIDIEDKLEHLPDELFSFVKETVFNLREQFKKVESEAIAAFYKVDLLAERKDQAKYIFTEHKEFAPLIFCMLDQKSYNDKIWKIIEPKNVTKFGVGEE